MIDHLFICEPKALKLDLTILLVHGEPNEQQQIMTISGHIAQRALKTKQLLIFEILMLYRWNSMLQATSKLNRLEYLNSWKDDNIEGYNWLIPDCAVIVNPYRSWPCIVGGHSDCFHLHGKKTTLLFCCLFICHICYIFSSSFLYSGHSFECIKLRRYHCLELGASDLNIWITLTQFKIIKLS